MPTSLKNNWMYMFVFTLLIAGSGLLYLNQRYPVVLSDEDTDYTGFGTTEVTPTPVSTVFPTPIQTPTPVATEDQNPDKTQNGNYELIRFNELKNLYSSADTTPSDKLKLSGEDSQTVKRILLLTEARYRNLLFEINTYIDRIEKDNNNGLITYRDKNEIRSLIITSRYKTEQISTSLDALKSAYVEFDTDYDIRAKIDNLIILTDQINASILDVISNLQIVNPPN